jgi:type III pantothenate kinase
MILLLDIGNSRIKWATLDHGRLHFGGSAVYRNRGLEGLEDLALSLWEDLHPPSRILAASVAGPAFAEALTSWTKGFWGLDVEFIVPQPNAFGVTNAYAEPRQLGADRWAALVAVRHRYRGPALIVDCGTAITIDVLSAEGRHLGGLIVPGLQMMRSALIEDTQGIALALELSTDSRAELLARDTRAGIAAGTLYAVVALIDRVTSDIAGELQTTLSCLITGGDAPTLLPLLQGQYQYEQHLVLKGLAITAGD